MYFSQLASKSRGPKVASLMTQAASVNATLINRPTGGQLTIQVYQMGHSIPVYTFKQSAMCLSPWFHVCGWQNPLCCLDDSVLHMFLGAVLCCSVAVNISVLVFPLLFDVMDQCDLCLTSRSAVTRLDE